MKAGSELRFTLADQRRFATLSGDANPVHLDPVAARRVAAGEPIVHGMHLLLCALDRAERSLPDAPALTIDAAFVRPAVLDEPIRVEVGRTGDLVASADGGVTLLRATLGRAPGHAAAADETPAGAPLTPRRARPAVRALADITHLSGVLQLPPARPLARTFPRATRALGADAVAAFAAVSALVGMECPGRDSLLSALRVQIARGARMRRLAWRVVHVDRRFGLVRIEIAGPGVAGVVDAFVRPQPTTLPTLAAAATGVAPDEFAGQRALVIGGSRGLGAAAALLVAAGGGVPIVTYVSGAKEAAALRNEARAAGRAFEIVPLDARSAEAPTRVAKIAARHRITHLYYCATPRIFGRRREPFDAARFDRFADVYVRAFGALCAAAKRRGEPLDVFYPSTIAVADTPAELTEYAAAKAAGECLCHAIEQASDDLRILVSRLPRVATDQTASIVAAAAVDPLEAMRPIVRAMHQRGRPQGR